MRVTNEALLERLRDLLRSAEAEAQLPQLLEEIQPFDLAETLSELEEAEARRVLSALEPSMAAEVLEHIEYVEQYRLLHHMDEETARRILDQMSTDEVVDLVGAIHPRQAEQLLKLLPPEYVSTIRNLATYPENSAGGRMTVDYISVRQHMTVEQVLAHIRKVGREAETISYIYVVDVAGRLVGVFSLRELLFEAPATRVTEFMTTNVISVPVTMDQEEVARVVSQYDLVAVPVVDSANRLLGIITVDDVIDVIEAEATEDVLRMGATAAPENVVGLPFLQTIWALAKPRLPWLIALLFLEMGSSFIVDTFSNFVPATIAIMLATFNVVITGESGNAATQALALVVRGMATGEIDDEDIPRVVTREALVGALVGTLVGGCLMLVGWLWHGQFQLGLAVGLALATNMVIAKVLGGLFPVIIHRLGIDPAVASGPLITTITDNSSMLIYYGVAALILRSFV
jgi:magnesium transporter